MEYKKNIFINCPFDKEYEAIKRAIIFTVISLGYNPRLSYEVQDCGKQRINNIKEIIKECKFSIHDLSRIKSSGKKEFYRLNMPFELGIEFGCREYSSDECHKEKTTLILGGAKYEYMKGLSDINGMDIKYHNNEIIKAIKEVRDWIVSTDKKEGLKHYPEIKSNFFDFNAYFYDKMIEKGYEKSEIYDVPLNEQKLYMKEFLDRRVKA